LKKDYDEEMKAFDPNTMEEKTLSAQNQRLQQELRRAEKQLQELNKDHCDLAGQLVTVRVELQKQKDVSEALRRQVLDFKSILGRDIKTFNADSLNAVLDHEVTEANSLEQLPQPQENPDARIPSVEEQVAILTNQNITLMEEAQLWRRKYEDLEKQSKSRQSFGSTSQTIASPDMWQSLSKRFTFDQKKPQ
jgi:chromosome segregation ATPase